MKTKDFRELLERFATIVKVEPLRPVTELIEIFCNNGVMRLGVTNGYTKVVGTLLSDMEFPNIVLSRVQLLKLLKLTTTEEVKITKKDTYITFRGNGRYKIPLRFDTDGKPISLNLAMPKLVNPVSYDIEAIKHIYNRNCIAVSTNEDFTDFRQFYQYNDMVVSTDSIICATTKGKLPCSGLEEPVLKIIASLPTKFDFAEVSDGIRIDCDNMEIYFSCPIHKQYPIDMVKQFCSTEMFDCQLRVNKTDFLNIIKRQDLFTKSWQQHYSILTIKEGCAIITNEDKTVEEELGCTVKGNTYEGLVFAIEQAMQILKRVDADFILYANSKCLGFEDSSGLYILSLVN